jgi:hypothetical protein
MRGRQTEVLIWREDWSKLTLPQASLPGTTAAAITITTVATTIATVTGCTLFMWR